MNWFRKKPEPPSAHAGNPGMGTMVSIAFANDARSWEDSDDLVKSLRGVLLGHGYRPTSHETFLELDGLLLVPQVVSVQPDDAGGVGTLSTIQVSDASLAPGSVFEYQHAAGEDVKKSFASGFDSWAQTDLPVFLDARRRNPEILSYMSMEPPESGVSPPESARRILFGPVLRMGGPSAEAVDEEHPFCPCCLFTNTHEAFRELVHGAEFHAVRFFAMRNADGSAAADCRVNGLDWPAGAAALINYVKTWPQRGVEYRKQYVAIHTPNAVAGS